MCVLEIPSFKSFLWNLRQMQIDLWRSRKFEKSLLVSQFKRVSSLNSDKVWFYHESLRVLPCTLEMLFNPSTIADILNSNMISKIEKRTANCIDFGIDERQTKSPRNSNNAPDATTEASTSITADTFPFQSSFYLEPLTPLQDASIDFDFFDN